jgi:peptidoglycan/xylan/chitin deacetylase (PgdA/CDA1 family)
MVSLTFDDGFADQLVASRILDKHDLSGTFYINSGLIGLPGYMTRKDLGDLKANGHEIGGHTVTHANLTTLSAAEANRQICQDRKNLLSWGHAVSSFAYPYSAFDTSVKKIAEQCGYRTARAVGSLKSPRACPDCPAAESIPPADLYATRTPADIDTSWSLDDLRNIVTGAEASGGWLTFNFHHLCDSCSPASIRPDVFEQFIAWLTPRSSTSVRTTVRTVQQVIPGTVAPAVAPIAPRPPAAPGVNALRNSTLETASRTDPHLPDCWTFTTSGTDKATYARTTEAHTGTFASRITMPSGTGGDAKLVATFDLGDCSPSVAGEHTYEVSAWYKSTTTEVYFTLYRRNAIGQWTYWTQSPPLKTAKGWTRAAWKTPPVPNGTVAASFGLTLAGPGTITTDDLGFVDNTPAAAPPPAKSADRIEYSTDPVEQSHPAGWLGIGGITIALMGLIAGLLDSYRTKRR